MESRAEDGSADRPPATLAAQGSEHVLRPNVNCTCRFDGKDFGLGESVCIRGTLATCSTVLNNTSWAISRTPCPLASLATEPVSVR